MRTVAAWTSVSFRYLSWSYVEHEIIECSKKLASGQRIRCVHSSTLVLLEELINT